MTLDYVDIINEMKNKVGKEQWVFLYRRNKNNSEDLFLYSALVPNEHLNDILDEQDWEMGPGEGLPGYGHHTPNFETVYLRFGNFENIEPLVYIRSFSGIEKNSIEISQELIHYFNLYYNEKENKYIEYLRDGDEREVILVDELFVKIRLKHLKIYLAAKKSQLVIYYDIWRFSNMELSELKISKGKKNLREEYFSYLLEIKDHNVHFNRPEANSSSWFLGKTIISGKENFNPDSFFSESSEEDSYQDFIVGIDKNGDNEYKACGPFNLGPNEFLKLVFFDRQVLSKYYDNPQKYNVSDGYVSCKNFWSMPIDNNRKEYVIVFLGDLGKHLSYKEQSYWKGFNVDPDGGLSRTEWNRSFMMKNSPPQMPDLYFKLIFEDYIQRWRKKFKWDLFKSLNESDYHYFSTLRIPLSESPIEFEQQVLSLSKVLIESINQSEIVKRLDYVDKEWKGIDKFEAFLNEKLVSDSSIYIKFLRNLQSLRSQSIAHRKSSNYEENIKKMKFLDFEKKGYIDNFIDILLKAIKVIQYLNVCFINSEDNFRTDKF